VPKFASSLARSSPGAQSVFRNFLSSLPCGAGTRKGSIGGDLGIYGFFAKFAEGEDADAPTSQSLQ
jgi:hypothetical protein